MANKIKTGYDRSKVKLKRIPIPMGGIYKKSKAMKDMKTDMPNFVFEEISARDEEFHQQAQRIKNQVREEIDNSIKEKLSRFSEIDFDKMWEEQRPVKGDTQRSNLESRIGREKRKEVDTQEESNPPIENNTPIENKKTNEKKQKFFPIKKKKDKASAEGDLEINLVGAWKIIISFFVKVGETPGALFSRMKTKARKYYKAHPDRAQVRRTKNKKLFRKIILFKRRVVSKEKAAAEYMARLIMGIDHRNEEMAEKTTKIVKRSNLKIMLAREYAEINKAKLLVKLVILLVIAIMIASCISFVTAYEYSYNGRVLGVVKNQQDVLKLLDIVTEQLTKEYQAEVKIDKDLDIVFERVISVSREIDTSEDVLKKLSYMQDMKAKAYAIYVNDNREVIVSSKDAAEKVLENVKNRYLNTSGTSQYESVGFAEDVQIREYQTKLGRIQNSEDALNKILTGAVENKVHVVQSGETFSGIAKQYGIHSGDLRGSNPGITPERLSIGQEIILTQAVPLITVQTVEVATYIEPIPFETTNMDTGTMYKGEKAVKVRGITGERQVVARLTKNNGFEVAKTELKSEVIKEPVKEVILVGTKPPPPLQGSGTYIYPVNGARITTYFSRYHPAVDLAISSGTKIRASDGGTVISAGYSGSYGYVIRINHGGNRTTLYAHCSKILVKAGEKVYQGQQIGNVGSTGRSTGPHLHFELIINGVKKNPLSYL